MNSTRFDSRTALLAKRLIDGMNEDIMYWYWIDWIGALEVACECELYE